MLIASVPRRLRDTINVEISGQTSVESARVEDMFTDCFECATGVWGGEDVGSTSVATQTGE
jgi:hypothetical protein